MDVVGANFANVARRDPRAARRTARCRSSIPIGSGSIKDSPTPFAGVIDLIEMKALYFDAGDRWARRSAREPIPGEPAAEAKQYRERALRRADRHDEQGPDHVGGTRRARRSTLDAGRGSCVREQTLAAADSAGAVRLGPRAHRHPAAARRGLRLPAEPARPPAGRRHQSRRRTRKRSASPTRRSRSAGWCSRSSPTRNGDRFFVRIYSGTLKPQSRAVQPRQGRQGDSPASSTTSTPTRLDGLEEVPSGPGRRHRRPSSA